MEFACKVAEIRPDYFVLENVPGLLDPHAAAARNAFAAAMQRAGYRVLAPWLLNAADFGVPQERWRVFVVGHREGLAAPSPPGLQPDRVSAWQAIGDLESVDRISADGATARITGPAVSSYSRDHARGHPRYRRPLRPATTPRCRDRLRPGAACPRARAALREHAPGSP